MKETRININKKITSIEKVSKINYFLKQFILTPLFAGVSGFSIFFLFAICLDLIVNVFNPNKFLTIDIFTVLIGTAGFILSFGLSILESTKK